jgi:branched-chain amino acid transport system substrate-binding protein
MMRKLFFTMGMFIFLFSLTLGSHGVAGAAEPIKIGFMAPYVGVFTKYGTDMRDGFKLYLDEIKNKVAGREILFLTEDDEGKPEVGLVKTKKLVEKDQVHILAGIISSAVAYAVRDYVTEKKVPLLITNAGATKLTQEQRSPFIFRSSFANGQQDSAGGWYAYAKMGGRKVIMIGSDYAAGHEKGDGFKKAFKFMGGEVVEEIWPPLGTNDYAPYLAKIANFVGKVDSLWAFFAGSDAIRFVNQYDEYALKQKIKVFCEAGMIDEANLPSQKDAALGIEGYLHYALTLDNPPNIKFVKEYQKKYNYDPGVLSQEGYVGAQIIVKAIEAVKGKIENQEAFLKALKGVKFQSIRGPFRFDEHQNTVENVYIFRVEKRDGEYRKIVIYTIPDVDQYWMPKK